MRSWVVAIFAISLSVAGMTACPAELHAGKYTVSFYQADGVIAVNATSVSISVTYYGAPTATAVVPTSQNGNTSVFTIADTQMNKQISLNFTTTDGSLSATIGSLNGYTNALAETFQVILLPTRVTMVGIPHHEQLAPCECVPCYPSRMHRGRRSRCCH